MSVYVCLIKDEILWALKHFYINYLHFLLKLTFKFQNAREHFFFIFGVKQHIRFI